MNQRNIEALGDALFEALGREFSRSEAMAVARRMIDSRGVLVPSTLTEDDVSGMCHDREECRCTPASYRADLERIAKGEAT